MRKKCRCGHYHCEICGNQLTAATCGICGCVNEDLLAADFTVQPLSLDANDWEGKEE